MATTKLGPAPPTRVHKKRRARWRARLGSLAWVLDKSVQCEEALEKLLTSDRMNAAGVAALFSRAREFQEDKRRILAESGVLDGAGKEELREWFLRSAEEWPDEFLELAFGIYGERHRGRVLFVADSGHRAEFDPEKGWRPATG